MARTAVNCGVITKSPHNHCTVFCAFMNLPDHPFILIFSRVINPFLIPAAQKSTCSIPDMTPSMTIFKIMITFFRRNNS